MNWQAMQTFSLMLLAASAYVVAFVWLVIFIEKRVGHKVALATGVVIAVLSSILFVGLVS